MVLISCYALLWGYNCVLIMNRKIYNSEDEIISVQCADCHQQTIYLKIINAAKNTRQYPTHRLICAQCQLANPITQSGYQRPRPLNESA